MFEITALFVYKLQFMLELLIAELLFCWKLKRKNHFYIRLIVSVLVSFLLAFLIPIVSYDSIYVSLLFIVLAIISFVALMFCFDESIINILFCGVSSYCMQHIAYSLYQTFMVITLLDGGNSLNIYGSGATVNFEFFTFAIYLDFYIITYLGLYFIFRKHLKKGEDFYITNTWLFLIVGFIFLSAIFLNSIMIYTDDQKKDRLALIVKFVYSIIS